MRASAALLLVVATAACQPTVPDSGAGFEDYSSYLQRREAELMGQRGASAMPQMGAPAAQPQFSPEIIGSAIDSAEQGGGAPAPAYGAPGSTYPAAPAPGALIGGTTSYTTGEAGLPANRPRANAPAGIRTESGEMAGAGSHTGISDENDFNAVSERRSREDDAEFMAQNRASYTVIPPQPVPERVNANGPNIVQFALSTSHNPGTPVYKRSSLRLSNPGSACARYASPDLAQQDFLASGGPDRDRKGLDPDGDGFACGWDPRPFRAAR
ncbi:hypothetical protein [Cereibacter azotoformans]|uniref:hypothetical protein n=1 Tax=Cereibacter azotoformans TaxID=43057 RepID=UPI000C6CE19B|nr:hypothetical protein [Cereibacter azotoformans]